MASTISRKHARTASRQRAPRVGDLTLDEFRAMIESVIDRKMAEWMDPDAGLELRPEIVASIERQRKEYAAGKHGKSLDEVAARLGLDD
ncbi:MAG: hypothetical protein AB1817_00870 [Chloroflexota bacterium]